MTCRIRELRGIEHAQASLWPLILSTLKLVLALAVIGSLPAAAQTAPTVMHWQVATPESAPLSSEAESARSFVPEIWGYPSDALPTRLLGIEDADEACGRTGFSLSAGYLLWSISGANLPPLLRAGMGTSPQDTGVLTQPGRTLLGGDSDSMTSSGFEIGACFWLDHCQSAGWEFRYAGLPRRTEQQGFDSAFNPRLGRPYLGGDGSEAALLVAHPDFASGALALSSWTELHSVEVLQRQARWSQVCSRVDSLVGFRFLHLGEGLQLDQSTSYFAPQPPIAADTLVRIHDSFRTRNRFSALTLGFDASRTYGMLELNLLGGLSLGWNAMRVDIDGARSVTTPSGSGSSVTATFDDGFLAQSTNIGTWKRNRFAVLPELQTGITAHLTHRWRWEVGYRLFYLSEAVQPGEQIDRQLSQLPPEPPVLPFAPQANINTGGVLVQGLRTTMVFDF